ncbi:MAG TPA: hypothetical protein VF918_08700 [Anaerolineales bacterium]
MSATERVCTKYGPPAQPIENFGWKDRLRGKRHAVCKICTAKRSSNWYYQNQDRQKENVRLNNQSYRQNARDYVWDYLTTHPCSICGEPDPLVLEFHHTGQKDNEVSRLMGRGASLDALKAEIEKCQVVCSNCHRRITAREQGWYKGLIEDRA